MSGIKKIIRKIFQIREKETIRDGIRRHKYNLLNKFNRKEISIDEFAWRIEKLGIKKGDTLIVHSAWRECYSLKANPYEVIDRLIKIIGNSGTLLMPCYGHDKTYFDVNNTKSYAGALSEVFRNYPGVVRSEFPDSAMCGYGVSAENILSTHENSKYAFDNYSPYYRAMQEFDAKVLLLGMGTRPYKISVFHCASYESRETNEFYRDVYTRQIEAKIVKKNGEEVIVSYVDRKQNISNDNREFRKLFCKVPHTTIKDKQMVTTLFKAKDAYLVAKEFCENGGKIYACKH